ncbi:hypothetical protein O6H91_23G057700 [Diphasiastrum complanatum]|uniref:Uncharacterized protein n=2 Tax=Diphasiastrum complanatum TaxID=34168 RepID=A0ACC2AB99_DIPCM|nr:hypothetical protein O6H91_23G014400 [Diphasiastrum complanatum]KAJ7514746.1 hypothetical protein O6H91_23G057700 [Diphasiastrum complanatum]
MAAGTQMDDALSTSAFLTAIEESKQLPSSLQGGKNGMNMKKALVPHYSLAFVYGTLKKGFGNYWLMEEQILKGHAGFFGTAETKQRFPLVCGPFQVPFLLNIPSDGQHVVGELYLVDRIALARLDELEGVDKGHYERSCLLVSGLHIDSPARSMLGDGCIVEDWMEFKAEAYFAASHYARRLAQAPHLKAYTEKEAANYTRRKDRPQNYTFLQHIQAWIAKQGFANLEH